MANARTWRSGSSPCAWRRALRTTAPWKCLCPGVGRHRPVYRRSRRQGGSADAAGVALGHARIAGGGPITGVVQGFLPDGTTNMVGYRAASTAAYVLCCSDPDVSFRDPGGQRWRCLAAADIGLNASIIVAAGSTYTKRSGVMLDTSTKATTATPNSRSRVRPAPDNARWRQRQGLGQDQQHTDSNAVAGV
jgi:hypothetical protein